MAPNVPLSKCPQECGLVIIVGGEEEKIVPIPLKEVSVKARLVDFVAEVTLEQTFKNEEKGPVEAVYMFPLDEEASVVQFQAELDGRTVKGEVKEKEEAKKQYEEAMEKRQTAFLASENKPDIFQVKVGNLSPGAQAKVRLVYLTETSVEGKALRFFLPTTIAPRYIPESDTSQEAKEIGDIPYSLSSPAPMKILVECEMKSKIVSMESPTHTITTDTANTLLCEGGFYSGKASLTGQTTDMDRDFILLVATENPHQPRVCIERLEMSAAAFVSLVPSFNLDEQPAELVFLLDRSGSMMGESIQQAKRALTLFLRSLPMDCYFNIVGFGSSHELLFPKSVKYEDGSLKTAISHASSLDADLFGTAIFHPLKEIFGQEPVKGYLRQLFVLTDGKVSNTNEVIKLVKQNCHNTRVFSLGIGDSASHHLIGGIARAGGGTAEYATYREALEPKVQRQLKNALFPSLSEVSVSWEGVSSASSKPDSKVVTEKTLLGYRKPAEQKNTTEDALKGPKGAPFHIPPVFDGSRLLVYCIWEDGSVPTGVTITAKSPDGPLTTTVSVKEEDVVQGDLVHKLAARKLIRDLEEGTSLLHSVISEPSEEKLKEEIVKLGIKYGLVSSHTSFVAIDPHKQGSDKELWAIQTRQVASQIAHGFDLMGAMGMGSLAVAPCVMSSRRKNKRCAPAPPKGMFLCCGRGFSAPVMEKADCLKVVCLSAVDDELDDVEVQEEEVKFTTEPQPVDKLEQVLSFIRFDGSFSADPELAKAIGADWQEVQDAGKQCGADLSCWVTALAIKFMEVAMESRKETWELAAAKSKKWLSKSSPDSDSLLKKAEEFLKAKGITEKTI